MRVEVFWIPIQSLPLRLGFFLVGAETQLYFSSGKGIF